MTYASRIEPARTSRRRLRAIQSEIQAWSQEDPVSRLLAAVLFVFALFIVFSMAIIQRRAYSALPWGDMWDYWIWYLKPHPNLLIKLFALHNEHRIVVARLFFIADQMFFRGRAIFVFVSIFIIQLFHAILLCRLAWLAHPHRKALPIFIGSTAFVCLFSAVQYANFTWSFQIQFVAVYFAATGAVSSLMVLARLSDEEPPASERRRRLWLICTIFVGVIATYSMANGLLVWPILLLEAFWFGLPRQTKLTLLVASIAMWVLYFWGYTTPPQTSSIREGFHQLPQSFAFAMCVLGSPLNAIVSEVDSIFSIGGEKWQLVWTAAGGLVGFIAGALLLITFVRNRRHRNRADAVILHLLLFLFATALLIGLGRANFPLQDALHSRYATPALLFWFCIWFLFFSLIARGERAQDNQSLVLFQFAGLMVILLVIVLYQPTQMRYARKNALDMSEYESSIGAPVYDPELWGKSYYNPRGLITVLRYMQAKHLSIFSPGRLRWLGDPITAHYHIVAPGKCTGSLNSNAEVFADPELPGLRLNGWGWDLESGKTAKSIVMTDKQGRILGFGYTGFGRPDVRATRFDIGWGAGWTAYIPGLSHDFITAYMVARDGSSACLIGDHQLSPFTDVPLNELGKELLDIDVSIEGAWAKDGYRPGSDPPPSNTTVMGSWGKGYWDTGTLRLGPFPTGSSDAIILPILTGADSRGLSITALDSKTGETVAKLSPPPVTTNWRGWGIRLPEHDMELEIVAQDQGVQPGEWLAVGMPHEVK